MKLDKEQFQKELRQREEAAKKLIAENMEKDLRDEDGYPTEAAIEIIENWPYDDIKGWFDFIGSIWHLKDWGWTEVEEKHDYLDKMVHRYYISTAGWSGNESLIRAMENNKFFCWTLTWVQSRRGGHYIFESPTGDFA